MKEVVIRNKEAYHKIFNFFFISTNTMTASILDGNDFFIYLNFLCTRTTSVVFINSSLAETVSKLTLQIG